MQNLYASFEIAIRLMIELNPLLLEIVALSLRVSLTAVLLASVCGFFVGAALALCEFPGRGVILVILNSFMGLPPVVVGLTVYLLLSRAGPMGPCGLLFTPAAMIIAQWILVSPLIAALSRQVIEDLHTEYRDLLRSLGAKRFRMLATLLWEGRFSLTTVMLAGFGRAVAEVGAVLIVGGNIVHHTRVMTTSIALETAKGNLSHALALGMILIFISCLVNAAISISKNYAERASN
ncbi:MAG: ABC transporter permease [Methylococcaceae bacterium]|nr:ABC transporter permease [Methylococcaceae bacterium]